MIADFATVIIVARDIIIDVSIMLQSVQIIALIIAGLV
jgi:hypothetical protein